MGTESNISIVGCPGTVMRYANAPTHKTEKVKNIFEIWTPFLNLEDSTPTGTDAATTQKR